METKKTILDELQEQLKDFNVTRKNYTKKDDKTDEMLIVDSLTVSCSSAIYDELSQKHFSESSKTKNENLCELYKISSLLNILGIENEEVKNEYLKDGVKQQSNYFYIYFPKESKSEEIILQRGDDVKFVEIFNDYLQSLDVVFTMTTHSNGEQLLSVTAFGKLKQFEPTFTINRTNGAFVLTEEQKERIRKAKEMAGKLHNLQSFE